MTRCEWREHVTLAAARPIVSPDWAPTVSAEQAVGLMEVAQYLRDEVGCEVLSVRVEGRPVLVGFEPDLSEHRRREAVGVGAVLSRRLLHALWSLPLQIRWPGSSLDPDDLETLAAHPQGLVEVGGGSFARLYEPPGRVRAVGVGSSRLADAVVAVGLFPPIFVRFGYGSRSDVRDDDAVLTASLLGIGTGIASSSGLAVRSAPEPAEVGVPGVYRWWMAEVAYQAWLQANVH